MKSEIVFQYAVSGMGRYGDAYHNSVTVLADFEDPAAWPYRVDCVNEQEEEFAELDAEPNVEKRSYRISKACFEQIKAYLAGNTALLRCAEYIENEVWDGAGESFGFLCGATFKQISGTSVLGSAYGDEKLPAHLRSDNYWVAEAYETIKGMLQAQNVNEL